MSHSEGFDEFYQATYSRLVGQLYPITGSLSEAEEVVQEAFVRALARWSHVRAYDVPEAWVRRVALNLAVNELRRARSRLGALARLSPKVEEVEEPPMSAEAAALVDALRRLPSSHRQALLLHYALDLPVSEVAQQLRLTPATVRGRLFRARARLRKLLSAKAEEVDSSHG
jgi:RNA polymerase sigma-70 factor, ECF subfamily